LNKTLQKICHRELIHVFQILSESEKEILELIVKAKSDMEISEKLDISLHTSRAFRKNIMAKNEAKNVVHLVAMALKSGEYE
jgi:DNA-binding CsgD family transcriptional regulator